MKAKKKKEQRKALEGERKRGKNGEVAYRIRFRKPLLPLVSLENRVWDNRYGCARLSAARSDCKEGPKCRQDTNFRKRDVFLSLISSFYFSFPWLFVIFLFWGRFSFEWIPWLESTTKEGRLHNGRCMGTGSFLGVFFVFTLCFLSPLISPSVTFFHGCYLSPDGK